MKGSNCSWNIQGWKGYENEPEEDIKKQFFQKNQYDKNFNELAILYNARKLSKEKYLKKLTLYYTEISS